MTPEFWLLVGMFIVTLAYDAVRLWIEWRKMRAVLRGIKIAKIRGEEGE